MRIGITLALLILPARLLAATVIGYIGTSGNAIYQFEWDAALGTVSKAHEAVVTSNPSYLALHPNGRFLYSTNEHGPADETDRISAFAVRATGLEKLGSVSAMGRGPCHLSVDASGRWLVVSNYGSGHFAVYPIGADGRLGAARQVIEPQGSAPHAHEAVWSPNGRFLLAVDLGQERVFVYRFDRSSGQLTANDPAAAVFPTGYGPRHLAFSRDGNHVYVLAELASQLVTFKWDARRGALTQLADISTLPAGFAGRRSSAELALSRDGRFLYASNRGDSNNIAVFSLGRDALPSPIGHVASGGTTPRFIGFDPSGRYLLAANQGTGEIAVFRMDQRSGALQQIPSDVRVPKPSHILFQTQRQ